MKPAAIGITALIMIIFGPFFPGEIRAETTEDLTRRIDRLEAELSSMKKELARVKTEESEIGLGMGEKKYVFGDYWDDGLFFKTPQGRFTARIGGSINLDARWTNTQSALRDYLSARQGRSLHDGSELRRGRVYLKGTMYEDVFYKFQIDYSDTAGTYYVHDTFVGMMNVPVVGAVLVGHAARAWGLNPVPDENWLTFMEWAPPFGFSIGQLLGVAAGNAYLDNHINWAVQVGKTAGIHCREIGESYNLNARITGTPWYIDGGRSMLHQGISYTYRGSSDETRYAAGPSFSEEVPFFVDTGILATDRVDGFNYSAAVCQGPFSFQGEYYGMLADLKDGASSAFFQGAYLMGTWYLTGEYRGNQYVTSYGGFDKRLHPHHNFDIEDGTWGAFELAARYSWMDLNDDDIRGGILNQFTGGFNWYFNPNFRWMWNYVHSHVNGVGSADIIETRFGIDF